MELVQIIREAAARMDDVMVEVDELHGTVAIGDDVFMQGDEASEFIEKARELYDRAQYVSLDECYAHLAEPYTEL